MESRLYKFELHLPEFIPQTMPFKGVELVDRFALQVAKPQFLFDRHSFLNINETVGGLEHMRESAGIDLVRRHKGSAAI